MSCSPARPRATRRQSGCVRYSWVPGGSALPRRFRCQPDLIPARRRRHEGSPLTAAQRAHRGASAMTPLLLDTSLDEPTVAMLHPLTRDGIRLGGEYDTEMGVFSAAAGGLRVANLTSLFDDHVPFVEAGVLDDTRSSAAAERRESTVTIRNDATRLLIATRGPNGARRRGSARARSCSTPISDQQVAARARTDRDRDGGQPGSSGRLPPCRPGTPASRSRPAPRSPRSIIGAGRGYLDGWLLENPSICTLATQPHPRTGDTVSLPSVVAVKSLVRFVDPVEEPALGRRRAG